MPTCTLTATFTDLSGRPKSGLVIKVSPYQSPPNAHLGVFGVAESVLIQGSVEAATNLQGVLSLTLEQGVWVWLKLPNQSNPVVFLVPSVDEADLFDHLFPRATLAQWEEVDETGLDRLDVVVGDLELAEGNSTYLAIMATYSNGAQLLLDPLVMQFIGDVSLEEVGTDRVLVTKTGPGPANVTHAYEDASVWEVRVHAPLYAVALPTKASVTPPPDLALVDP